MKSIVPYLTFDGTCREAMTYYAKVMQAEVDIFDAEQMPDCHRGEQGQGDARAPA